MFGVRDVVERFHLFERNRFPFELKVLGLAFYVQMSSLRRTARALSEFRSVSKTAVWRWVVKLKACLSLSIDVKPRRLPNLRHAHILLQQPKEVNLKLPRPACPIKNFMYSGSTLWSLRNVRKAALNEWGLYGFLPLKFSANF
ncbi:hypothetical protein KEJ34_00745 [Candidatus Bathyarchaeota archaeon]|nr:hypothetical protein [Candidatus Bathyarchaeota archaeon]